MKKYYVLVAIIIVLVIAVVYFAFFKKVGPIEQPVVTSTPAPVQENPIVNAPIKTTLQKEGWRTYENSKYGFSIQYPCDEKCQADLPVPSKSDYFWETNWLPTGTRASVIVSSFTDESVKAWNDSLKNSGEEAAIPFQFSLSSFREALNLPLNSKCKIASYFGGDVSFGCSIVSLGGKKAVKFDNGVIHSFDGDPHQYYYVNLGGNNWLTINEAYNLIDYRGHEDFLTNEANITPEIRGQLNAVAEVLKTLEFTN